jgi:tight adherence protein C
MHGLTWALLTFVGVAGATFITGYVLMRRWPAFHASRLASGTASVDPSVLRWDDESRSAWQRVVERLGRAAGPRENVRLWKWRTKLVHAGYHDPRAVPMFLGAKLGMGLAFCFSYTVYGMLIARVLPNVVSISLMLGAAGFFLPDVWLRARVRERQRAITNALPDVLDLLMVCVEAGMGFDAAVARVASLDDRRRSPLHQELLRMHLEMRAGRPREEALRGFGERTGVQEVQAVVSAFIQTDKLGTPLGRTLRVHAEAARIQRRHRAEERAYLAPLKMIFPTVFFLMPAFFLVSMGPPLLKVAEMFKNLGGD